LLGLHRTFDVDEIQTRFWDGALDSIMFPPDPVANASSIISDLRAIFPPMQNRFLFAPMVAITWSYPPILRCELGILVEIGIDPIELIGITIFGQLSAVLPDLDNPIVQLQLDAYGGIYLERQELMIDANLFDSSILSLDLQGGMALRLRWGENSYFAIGHKTARLPRPRPHEHSPRPGQPHLFLGMLLCHHAQHRPVWRRCGGHL
jgi:hypothetical protein